MRIGICLSASHIKPSNVLSANMPIRPLALVDIGGFYTVHGAIDRRRFPCPTARITQPPPDRGPPLPHIGRHDVCEGIRALNETGPALDRYNHSAQVPARTISAHLRSIWGHHILDPTLMPVLPAESDQDVYG